MSNIDVPVWWKSGGGMMVRRDCLPTEHPESQYSYIKNVLKKNPEDYGIQTDRQMMIKDQLEHLTRDQLINKLANLMEEFEAYQRAGF